jgi:hypothetical protein
LSFPLSLLSVAGLIGSGCWVLPEFRRQIEVHRLLEQRLLGFCIAPGLGQGEPLPQRNNQGLTAGISGAGGF